MKKNKYGLIVIATIAIVVIAGIGIYAINKSNNTMNNAMSEDASNSQKSSSNENMDKYASLKGDEFDEMYIAEMLAHHDGAISMSEMVGAGTDRKELLDLAQAIMQTQTQELMKMQEWQTQWGYEKTMGGHASHAGMGNEMSGTMMDMGKELEGLKGSDFDKKFLELMIEHHQQAVDMSKYASTNAKHQEVKDLAKAITSAQNTEIAQMKQWQMDWGFKDSSSSMPGMNH
ncbi:MAG: DUF305 domain-containing protein [Candidatus Saccharimonadota bacterium]